MVTAASPVRGLPGRLGRGMLGSRVVEALASPHGVDRYLETVNPMWAVQEVRARVVQVQRETDDVTTLTLRPTGTWRGFRAGQFVQVGVEIDGARRTRCFSITSSDLAEALYGDRTLTITVRAHEEGTVSKYLARSARPGLVLHLSQADGAFTLPAMPPRHLLMVSGGSGITPLMAMVRSLADFRYEGRITFLHYSRSPESTIFADELKELDRRGVIDLHLVHTRHGGQRFSEWQLRRLAPRYAETDTFACGPAGMVQQLREVYAAAGAEERLRLEYFKTATLGPSSKEATGRVSFTESEVDADSDGDTLLVQAERLGLSPAYGCRMGICLTCTTRKTEGTVRNVVTGVESDQPDEDIQPCVTTPAGDCAVRL